MPQRNLYERAVLRSKRAVRRVIGPAPKATPTMRAQRDARVLPPPMTRTSAARLLYFAGFYERIRDVEGDVVECGVGHGDSLVMLSILASRENAGRRVWGFDSFAGFPEPTAEDRSPRNPQAGEWKADLPNVIDKLLASGFDEYFVQRRATLIPGFFETSLELFRGKQIALLHLDCDLYQSYRTCLEALYPLVSPGGIVAFDEYVNTGQLRSFPGARQAIDEYLGAERDLIESDPDTGQYFMVKPHD